MLSVRSPPSSQWPRPQALEDPLTTTTLTYIQSISKSCGLYLQNNPESSHSSRSSLAFTLVQLRAGDLGIYVPVHTGHCGRLRAHSPVLWLLAP